MVKKFSLGLVVVLAINVVFSGASFAFDMVTPTASQACIASSPEWAAVKDVPRTGVWSKFGPLSDSDQALFREALAGFVGVQYEPKEVRKQIVAGMNYDFFCSARDLLPGAEWYPVMVHIFKPLQGAVIVKIQKIETP